MTRTKAAAAVNTNDDAAAAAIITHNDISHSCQHEWE